MPWGASPAPPGIFIWRPFGTQITKNLVGGLFFEVDFFFNGPAPVLFQIYINYIQQCSIVQLCILRKLEAFCMPDVGGHVISREFSRDVQLTNIARCM